MTWKLRYHDERLQDAVLALPVGLLARYLQLTDRMVLYGPDLGMPHTRAMGSGLFELRLVNGCQESLLSGFESAVLIPGCFGLG